MDLYRQVQESAAYKLKALCLKHYHVTTGSPETRLLRMSPRVPHGILGHLRDVVVRYMCLLQH